jgi:hypothetical protein
MRKPLKLRVYQNPWQSPNEASPGGVGAWRRPHDALFAPIGGAIAGALLAGSCYMVYGLYEEAMVVSTAELSGQIMRPHGIRFGLTASFVAVLGMPVGAAIGGLWTSRTRLCSIVSFVMVLLLSLYASVTLFGRPVDIWDELRNRNIAVCLLTSFAVILFTMITAFFPRRASHGGSG